MLSYCYRRKQAWRKIASHAAQHLCISKLLNGTLGNRQPHSPMLSPTQACTTHSIINDLAKLLLPDRPGDPTFSFAAPARAFMASFQVLASGWVQGRGAQLSNNMTNRRLLSTDQIRSSLAMHCYFSLGNTRSGDL